MPKRSPDMPEKDLSFARMELVPLERINSDDDTFQITTRTNVADLLASIPHDGLLNPPVVIKRRSAFTIVSGFRRIEAYLTLGRAQVVARVLSPDTSNLECLRFAIADNAFQRPLNLIESSRALHKLAAHSRSGSAVSESASSLGLPSNPVIIKKIRDLCLLPTRIQRAILDETISLSMAVDLKSLEPHCAAAFAQLFDDLKLSLNKQREILTLVSEIARRESLTAAMVLDGRRLQTILSDPDLDRRQKARQLRAYLRQRRFPQIVQAEAKFRDRLRLLNLGNDIQLIPPQNFEGTTYTVKMSFDSITRLKALYTRLDRIIQNPALKKILSR